MGVPFIQQVNAKRVYVCSSCSTPLMNYKDLVAKHFVLHGRRAFLFSKWVNLTFGEVEKRYFKTGFYMTKVTFCKKCKAHLGYFYEYSFSKEERNIEKEGKIIIEEDKIRKVRSVVDQPFRKLLM